MGVMVQHVADHQRGLFQPGNAPQRRQVRLHDEVAIALRPARRLVAGHRLHIDVGGQQIVAAMRLVMGGIDEDWARKRLPTSRPCMSTMQASTVSISPRRPPSSTDRTKNFRPFFATPAWSLRTDERNHGRHSRPWQDAMRQWPVSPTACSAALIAAWRVRDHVADRRTLEAVAFSKANQTIAVRIEEADGDVERPVVRRLDADEEDQDHRQRSTARQTA